MSDTYTWWKSKTVWGAILVAVARIVLDHSPQSVMENVGGIIAVAGARDAVSKNGNGK